MIFKTFKLEQGRITATAEGHADAVVKAFRDACRVAFAGQGPWRFTQIHGVCPDDAHLDSEMRWEMIAERKTDIEARRGVVRTTISFP